jgi:lipopolysaccharide export LptBFGC system permease protein LptF
MKLHRYIFQQLLIAFVISAAGMIFIAMPGLAIGAVHKMGSVGMMAVLKYMPMVVAVFVPYVLPVALLLALVSTYGRLAALHEWTAIRMAGVNPYRMLLPAFALASIAGGGVYLMNAELLPRIKVREKTFRIDMLRDVFKNLSPGKTTVELGGFYLSATFRDPENPNTFYDCFVDLPEEHGEEREGFFAEAVRFEFDDTDMRVYLYGPRGAGGGVEYGLEEIAFTVSQESLVGDNSNKVFRSSRYKTSGELREAILSGDLDEARMEDFSYRWHQRIANAVTCLMFVLVGCSTGVLLRKGTQLAALAVAVGYALVYWIFSMRLGKQLAESGAVEPWLGAWGPLAIFCLLGAFLTHRTFRE